MLLLGIYILISPAFISNCGSFPKNIEKELNLLSLNLLKIPKSENPLDPLKILTNDTEKAKWNNQKLPSDSVSIENATILTNSERWSLMIDLQLQE